MKAKIFFPGCLVVLLLFICLSSCKKDSATTTTNNLSPINGTFQTTVFGGANDTINVAINSATASGTITYISSAAAADSKFSVNDVLFSNITSAGSNTYTASGTYRYGNGNASIGHTAATLTLNSSTILFVHYSADAGTGITPPDYYFYKQ